MARLLKNSIQMSGSVGTVTFRRMKDGTIVATQKIDRRVKTRTPENMRAQLPMGNLNQVADLLCKDWFNLMEGCENKRKARGRFFGLNMKRDVVYYTKAQQGAYYTLLCRHQISQGSLQSISHQLLPDNCLTTDIRLSRDITPQTTLGEFSADVLTYNPEFQDGDTLLLYLFQQKVVEDDGYPYVDMSKQSVCLQVGSSALLSEQMDISLLCRKEGLLSLATPLSDSGACFVHLRVDSKGMPLVSPQIIVCVNPLADEFRTNEAFEAAVASRGGYKVQHSKGVSREIDMAAEAVRHHEAFYVTVFSSDSQAGVVTTGRGTYKKDSLATLTAVPEPGHSFLRWTDQAGQVVSTQSVCQVVVRCDSSFTAHFE